MRKKRYILGGAGLLLGIAFSGAVTIAYLTRSVGEVRNVITAGSVKARLTEAHWDAEKALKVYPGQTLEKDPVVQNTGKNEANVFLEVRIPVENIFVVDEKTGKKTEKERKELFQFEADTGKWTLLSKEQDRNSQKYVYGYKKVLMPGESTAPLFSEIVTVSYLEGELDVKRSYDVPVTAKVIQMQDEGMTMEKKYETYLKQYEADRQEDAG